MKDVKDVVLKSFLVAVLGIVMQGTVMLCLAIWLDAAGRRGETISGLLAGDLFIKSFVIFFFLFLFIEMISMARKKMKKL